MTICRTRRVTRCCLTRDPRAGPRRRRGGKTSSTSSGIRSAPPSAVTPTCSPSCCPDHGNQIRPACSTCPAAWRHTHAASGTARHSHSTRMSSTASAWRPWLKSRNKSPGSGAVPWAPATLMTSWPGFARMARRHRWPVMTRWLVRPLRSPAPRSGCRICSARRCRRHARSSPCHRTWPSSARRPTTRRRPGTARAPARTCSTTCIPDRPGAGPWRPRHFTKGCPDTTRSSPACSSCRTCPCC